MAQKSDADLQIQRAEIEDETTIGANTAARVGQMFEDAIDSKLNIENIGNNVADPTNDQDVATKAYVDATAGGGAVISVNGNTGVVVLGAGDIGFTPSGGISATDVDGALNELDDEKADALLTFRRETASYTLDATDLANVNAGATLVIEMNVGSANNLTIPLNSAQAFPLGTRIIITQYGGGVTSVIGTGGVTVRLSAGVATLGGQYCKAVLIKVDTDEWYCDNGDPTVISSTWTPTLTNTTNITGSTAYLCSYSRIGNRVTVSGRVDIDPTAAASTVLGISLPVASAFSTANQAGGAAFSPGIAGQGAAILSDATNDRLTLQYVAVDVTSQAFYFSAGYEVI